MTVVPTSQDRLRSQHFAIFAYANAGVFCDGYILSSIGLALITLGPHFRLDAFQTGLIGAMTLFGILIGAPLFGHFTDRYGRRVLMIADLCAFVLVAIAQIFVTKRLGAGRAALSAWRCHRCRLSGRNGHHRRVHSFALSRCSVKRD